MSSTIRKMQPEDKLQVMQMMRIFYASPAVLSNGSEEIFLSDFETCVGENPYLEGFMIENAGEIQGYAMVAKSYSTEFGKPCIWIEDLYIKEPYRGCGIGSQVLQFITDQYPHSIFRLEVEEENVRAIATYKKNGFSVLPYMEMKK